MVECSAWNSKTSSPNFQLMMKSQLLSLVSRIKDFRGWMAMVPKFVSKCGWWLRMIV